MAKRPRSLSELPGHLRVPILKRKDTERTQRRLEAGVAGMEELRVLREQQQQLIGDTMAREENRLRFRCQCVDASASVTKGHKIPRSHGQNLHNAACSVQTAASLASISEESDNDNYNFRSGVDKNYYNNIKYHNNINYNNDCYNNDSSGFYPKNHWTRDYVHEHGDTDWGPKENDSNRHNNNHNNDNNENKGCSFERLQKSCSSQISLDSDNNMQSSCLNRDQPDGSGGGTDSINGHEMQWKERVRPWSSQEDLRQYPKHSRNIQSFSQFNKNKTSNCKVNNYVRRDSVSSSNCRDGGLSNAPKCQRRYSTTMVHDFQPLEHTRSRSSSASSLSSSNVNAKSGSDKRHFNSSAKLQISSNTNRRRHSYQMDNISCQTDNMVNRSTVSNRNHGQISWDNLLQTIGISNSTSSLVSVSQEAIAGEGDERGAEREEEDGLDDENNDVFDSYGNDGSRRSERTPLRKVGRSFSFSCSNSSGLLSEDRTPYLRFDEAQRNKFTEGRPELETYNILPSSPSSLLNNHGKGFRPVMRRASMQCEAVLTKSSFAKRIVNPIQDVDIKHLTTPGPLHAVMLQYTSRVVSEPTADNDTNTFITPKQKSKIGSREKQQSISKENGNTLPVKRNFRLSDNEKCVNDRNRGQIDKSNVPNIKGIVLVNGDLCDKPKPVENHTKRQPLHFHERDTHTVIEEESEELMKDVNSGDSQENCKTDCGKDDGNYFSKRSETLHSDSKSNSEVRIDLPSTAAELTDFVSSMTATDGDSQNIDETCDISTKESENHGWIGGVEKLEMSSNLDVPGDIHKGPIGDGDEVKMNQLSVEPNISHGAQRTSRSQEKGSMVTNDMTSKQKCFLIPSQEAPKHVGDMLNQKAIILSDKKCSTEEYGAVIPKCSVPRDTKPRDDENGTIVTEQQGHGDVKKSSIVCSCNSINTSVMSDEGYSTCDSVSPIYKIRLPVDQKLKEIRGKPLNARLDLEPTPVMTSGAVNCRDDQEPSNTFVEISTHRQDSGDGAHRVNSPLANAKQLSNKKDFQYNDVMDLEQGAAIVWNPPEKRIHSQTAKISKLRRDMPFKSIKQTTV